MQNIENQSADFNPIAADVGEHEAADKESPGAGPELLSSSGGPTRQTGV
jgi:hypothetical protein